MRAVVIASQGRPVGPNVKLVNDWPEPETRPGHVVIKTEASALNHRDLALGWGLPGRELSYPIVTGADGAGVIESVGEGVDEAWVGQRVLINAAIRKPYPAKPGVTPAAPDRLMLGEFDAGTFAEKFLVPVSNVMEIGEVDAVEAAAFGLVHLTGWRMLISRAGLRAGQSVLIPGIGGGVALACLGIARHFGCMTVVTSRHEWKLKKAAELGADHRILDTGEDWSREVRAVTGKRGVDVCADSVGKAIHMPCIKSLARGGVFVTCGATSGADPVTDLTRLYCNQLTMMGSTMGNMDELRQVTALLRSGALQPVIAQVYDAARTADAFERLESGEQFGKLVLRWE